MSPEEFWSEYEECIGEVYDFADDIEEIVDDKHNVILCDEFSQEDYTV